MADATLPLTASLPLWETRLRLALGVSALAVGGLFWLLVLLVLLPFRAARARWSNRFAQPLARTLLWLTGSRFVVDGREHLQQSRPVVYVSNHSSLLDILIAAWLAPVGTVGVGKKEILGYPLVGWLFALSGCLAVDRTQLRNAARGLTRLAADAHHDDLSVLMWPEGTRSPDGRPRPFKRGFAHLAMLTGYDVVPVVVEGAHLAWPNKTLQLCPTTVRITVHPPISVDDWDEAQLGQHVSDVSSVFKDANG